MILNSEAEMISFGEQIGRSLSIPCVIELIGDVGTGKTTITKGIAKGLGIFEEITSPSFTISKRYEFKNGTLVHYDFYRLNNPGIMSEDLIENLNDEKTVTIIEWGNSVSEILPKNHRKFIILLNEDGSREIKEEK
ncbi:tRNA (adenosine(37)-N6)-threonylcarbamoyltransferase complex ATPase subunit type 1 TsaE [Candidatus Saccharibacteria bacterium]|nr:tRNA (adenosine(37)-N6)-threonylcarbamoyltransferase complex ATPase subunit type 1 TsaE [Candidatus Saccharibacteria bacterium]